MSPRLPYLDERGEGEQGSFMAAMGKKKGANLVFMRKNPSSPPGGSSITKPPIKRGVAPWVMVFIIIFISAMVGATAEFDSLGSVYGNSMSSPGNPETRPYEPEQAGGLKSLASSLTVFSPKLFSPRQHNINSETFDYSLIQHLNVTVCDTMGGGCISFSGLNAQDRDGLDHIKIHKKRYGPYYSVNWQPTDSDRGKDFRIIFSVAGLEMGSIEFHLRSKILNRSNLPRMIPIVFLVGDNPQIRARVLHEEGLNATEITARLIDEFSLSPDEVLETLLGENFSHGEAAEAVIAGLRMDAWEGSAFLRSHGYSARQTYDVLLKLFEIQSEMLFEDILSAAGYDPEEFLYFTALGSVRKFAPVLMFDGSYRGLPMSAQEYFQKVLNFLLPVIDSELGTITWTTPWYGPGGWDPEIPFIWKCSGDGVFYVCSRDECTCGMENSNFSSLTSGSVPTYYKVIKDGEGRLRIDYWWFYGFQHACSYVTGCPGNDGSHHGDWEHLQVTTDANRTQADYVTFPFHGDWYTRAAGGFSVDPETGLRPMVYVGKLGHGSYHDQTKSGWMAGTPHHCCEYADYRNPHSDTIWWNTYDNLVALAGDSEPWMQADRIGSSYEYNGTEYTITFWRWGPHVSYCNFGGDWCSDWEHNYAPGTHPTIGYSTNPPLGWETHSCSAEGCGDTYCEGLLYQAGGIYLNQGWPWDD